MTIRKYPNLKLFEDDAEVTKGESWVYSISVSGDGANADIDIYDGIDKTAATKKFHFETLSGTTISTNLKHPAHFREGIYIDTNATTSKITVEWSNGAEPLPPY